jgi:hypothetical protein
VFNDLKFGSILLGMMIPVLGGGCVENTNQFVENTLPENLTIFFLLNVEMVP